MNPLVKWAGGKRKLADRIIPIFGTDHGHYFEPFVGGASILLAMHPENATCFDINGELINLYNVVKEFPNELISVYNERFVARHSHDFYYRVRDWDRNPRSFQRRSRVERAARFLYLNKACYNGLWRENSNGQFNVPIGNYVRPSFTTPKCITEASRYFAEHNVLFEERDYRYVEDLAQPNDLVYFDPPYDVEQGANGFVSYSKSGFNGNDQRELRDLCVRLIERGVKIAVSNSDTRLIRGLYANDIFTIHEMDIQYSVGGTAESRTPKIELLITGNL